MGERILMLRKHLKMSQETFGNKIGLTKSGISNLESDKRNLTDSMFMLICSTFNVNENWLRAGDGDMFNKLDPDEEFSELLAEMALRSNAREKQFIMEFLKLDDSLKNSIWDFWEKVLDMKKE